jgi:hypothetical protein
MTATTERMTAAIGVGGMTVHLHVQDAAFLRMVEDRYSGFPGSRESAECNFDVELLPDSSSENVSALGMDPEEDVQVWREGQVWNFTRGDFSARWNPELRRGHIRQTANPYSVDSVLRIVHSLALARQGGFLVHAASAIRNGKAFLFSGVSGAGKTTISRLAPADATLLSDEISYVRPAKGDAGYIAYGTPFAGELAEPGANVQAPIDTLYLLAQGPVNRVDALPSRSEAARALLRNILFFAHDQEPAEHVFQSALDFVQRVPVKRLTFLPDQHVWDLIQ